MRHIKGQEDAAMYSQAAMTSSRNAAFMPVQPVERAPTLQDVFRGQPVDSYSAGEAIFWEGDTAGHIFDVLEGVLRVCKILPDGRRAIMGFIYPGDVLGVSLQSRYLFTAEAVEQLLLALVVPYLLVLGIPEKAVRRLRLDRLNVPYQIAWILGMAVLSMWYLPRLLNAAVASDAVRWCEYTTLLLGGGAFWWPLHSPLREQRIRLVPTSLLYLTAATVWCSIAGLILAFEQPVKRYVQPLDTLHIAESLVSDWSFTRETDQQTAGLLFWVGAGSVLLTEVMLVYYRWYKSPEVRNEGSRSLTRT